MFVSVYHQMVLRGESLLSFLKSRIVGFLFLFFLKKGLINVPLIDSKTNIFPEALTKNNIH